MSAPDPRQCWRTPPELWAKMSRRWDFYIDVAADSKSALCPEWFGPDHPAVYHRDGLTARWPYRAYCNPGFSGIAPWLEKAHGEVTYGYCDMAVVMTHVQTSARWFSDWAMRADEIIFLTPRVQFVPAPGIPSSTNSRDNMLVIYRRRPRNPPHPNFSVWNWRGGEK